LITTLKENGKPNVCFQGWSSFYGDCGGYYVMTPLLVKSHTYHNIMRDKVFCINFINASFYGACYETIIKNKYEADEFEVGGFTQEPASQIAVPRIKEAFMSLECCLNSVNDLSGQRHPVSGDRGGALRSGGGRLY
jgi:flavin reductase (DIM6/NTAB) family NADH-FMN oxidoreductase RutF